MTGKQGYCQPDKQRGCARMTLKRWYGKCPDCPALIKEAKGSDEPSEETS